MKMTGMLIVNNLGKVLQGGGGASGNSWWGCAAWFSTS